MRRQNLQKQPPNLQRKARGAKGEQRAAKYLQSNGYSIVEFNWQVRWAEVDIVAIEGDTLVFVEVKTRYSHEHGTPEEAITPHKLHALERSALLYKQEHPEFPDALRIDFVGIDYTEGNPPTDKLDKEYKWVNCETLRGNSVYKQLNRMYTVMSDSNITISIG